MKRKVRLYLFQEGGQAPDMNQIFTVAAQLMQQTGDPETVYSKLLELGLDEETVNSVVSQLVEQFNATAESPTEQAVETEMPQEQTEPFSVYAQEEEASMDNSVYEDFENELVLEKFGGTPSKKQWVSNVMKLVKKQVGGMTPKADSTDTGARETLTNNFFSSIKRDSDMAAIKNNLEAAFDYFQYGGEMSAPAGEMIDPKAFSKVPGYVQREKSYHYYPSAPITNMAFPERKPQKVYERTIGDRIYDMFHKDPRVQYKFQEGGFVDPNNPLYKFIYGRNDFADNSKNINDPYFEKGGMVDIIDDAGKVIGQTTVEDAEKRGLRHRASTSTSTKTNTNTQDPYLHSQGQTQVYPQTYFNPFSLLTPSMYGAGNRGKTFNYLGTWYQQQNPLPPLNNASIKSIDTKLGLLGRPKKITYNFTGTPGQDIIRENPFMDTQKEGILQQMTKGKRNLFINPERNFQHKLLGNDPENFDVYNSKYTGEAERHLNSMKPSYDFPSPPDREVPVEAVYMNNWRGYGNVAQDPSIGNVMEDGGTPISDIPTLPTKSSKDVWASVKPEIEESWGINQPQDYSTTFKGKNMYSINTPKLLDDFNIGASMAMNFFDQTNRGREAQIYNNLLADNLYTPDTTYDKGDWDPVTGEFRKPDGFRSPYQYGGSVDEETYMTEEEIAEFLANGGELEFLD